MRVLIVGGGVAGLTLAALLRQRGEDPTVIEALGEYGTAGYTVTLWPMGNRVLRGLGLTEGFRERSAALERTAMRDARGRLLRVSRSGPGWPATARPERSRGPTWWTCCGPMGAACPSGWA